MTALYNDVVIDEAIRLGATKVISKPLDCDILVSSMNQALEKSHLSPAFPQTTEHHIQS